MTNRNKMEEQTDFKKYNVFGSINCCDEMNLTHINTLSPEIVLREALRKRDIDSEFYSELPGQQTFNAWHLKYDRVFASGIFCSEYYFVHIQCTECKTDHGDWVYTPVQCQYARITNQPDVLKHRIEDISEKINALVMEQKEISGSYLMERMMGRLLS